jgi:hypothetical protein
VQKKRTIDKDLRKRVVRARKDLAVISKMAKGGDFPAIVYLSDILINSVAELRIVADAHTESVRRFASGCDIWPVLGRRGKQFNNEIEKFYDKIGLAQTIAGLSKDQVDQFPTPARKYVYAILRTIFSQKKDRELEFFKSTNTSAFRKRKAYEKYADQLAVEVMKIWKADVRPYRERVFNEKYLSRYYRKIVFLKHLSNDNKDDWFECLVMLTNIIHRGFPELDPELRPIGIYRAGKGGAKPRSRTEDANIREGIFIRFKSTLQSMLSKAPLNKRKLENEIE